MKYRPSVTQQITSLGFDYESLGPPIYKKSNGYALAEIEELGEFNGIQHIVIFKLIVVKPPFLRPMLKVITVELFCVMQGEELVGPPVYSRDYWQGHKPQFTKNQMLEHCKRKLCVLLHSKIANSNLFVPINFN